MAMCLHSAVVAVATQIEIERWSEQRKEGELSFDPERVAD